MIDKTREIALKTLYKIDQEQAYSNIELNEQIKQNRKNINEKDIGLISEIVYGVTTWKLTLDEIIKKHSKIKLKKISPWIKNILRMGMYQIIFLDKIPKSAAVNESVNLAKRYGHASSSNFVNAILRKVEKIDYEEFFKIEDDADRISKTTSMPKWIVEELIKENGIKQAEQICKNSNLKPSISIRVNRLKTTKEELIQKLKQKGIEINEAQQQSNKNKEETSKQEIKEQNFLILNKVKNIENLKEFKEGLFTIQDISAGQTAKLLNPKSGEKVLDACSAPGGKTTYLAEIMENTGMIDAWDIHEHRTKLVEQNAKRLGISIIKTHVRDASIYDENLKEKYDKILLDVPCLGIGVIKRKPDIKWQRKPEDIEEITKIQKQILENCSKYLKKGGTLVYSTCSILKEENEDVVNCFLSKNNQFFTSKEEKINILPSANEDGFFICIIHKK